MSLLSLMSSQELKDCVKILRENVTENVFKYGYYHERTQQASKRFEMYKCHYEKTLNIKD